MPVGERNGGASYHGLIPAPFAKPSPDIYPFFIDYFSCGLCPPFSDFFNDIMHTYGFHLLDFTPNAMACMALFAHLCEGVAGFHPSTMLFRHYFVPRVQQGDAISGSMVWILRPLCKGAYPEGFQKERRDEWRGRWCWIVEKELQSFCEVR